MARTPVKSGKTEMVAFRIEPRLRYLAEVKARQNDESLSSFVERALAYALLPDSTIDEPDYGTGTHLPFTLRPLANEAMWDQDPAERFALLATLGNFRLFNREESELFRQIVKLYFKAPTDRNIPTYEQLIEGYHRIKEQQEKGTK